MLSTHISIARASCPSCLRPARACICHCVHPCPSDVELLILQHPEEVGHAKNTARLLHLCVPGSRISIGETFDAHALNDLLHGPWQEGAVPKHSVLLYPETAIDPQVTLTAPPALPLRWLEQPQRLRLVLLDGTWRKSRKMLYSNPLLQQLPRIGLSAVASRRYAIRKAHAEHQLSSFEAAAYALAQLQGWDSTHPYLIQWLATFDSVIHQHQQLERLGRSTRSQSTT